MRRALLAAALAAGVTLGIAPQAVPRSAAQTLVVDKDKVQCPKAGFTSIQAAVTAALPGATIKVCPDQYNESVVVNKPSLTLVGATSVNVGKCIVQRSREEEDVAAPVANRRRDLGEISVAPLHRPSLATRRLSCPRRDRIVRVIAEVATRKRRATARRHQRRRLRVDD